MIKTGHKTIGQEKRLLEVCVVLKKGVSDHDAEFTRLWWHINPEDKLFIWTGFTCLLV